MKLFRLTWYEESDPHYRINRYYSSMRVALDALRLLVISNIPIVLDVNGDPLAFITSAEIDNILF